MIDKKARKQLASAIRNYASGLVNNEEFEELLPHWHSKDYAVSEIDYLGIGPYYKDDGVIRIKLSQEERKEFARWILFLQTDNEYEWPVYSRDRLNKFHEVILDIFTLGQFAKNFKFESAEFKKSGDFEFWPFISQKSYHEALKTPLFLKG